MLNLKRFHWQRGYGEFFLAVRTSRGIAISVRGTSSSKALKLLLDDVFEFFRDGAWHTLGEVAAKFNLEMSQVSEIITFLAQSGLLTLDKTKQKAMIVSSVQRVLGEDDETRRLGATGYSK